MMLPSQRAEVIGNEVSPISSWKLSTAREEIELEDRAFKTHTDCDGKVSIWSKFGSVGIADIFLVGVCGVFGGFLQKLGVWSWFFGGVDVVVRWCNVVFWQSLFGLRKMRQILGIYFLGVPFWECGEDSPDARRSERVRNYSLRPASVLVLWVCCGLIVVMTVVEDLADAATCAFGDFACALGGTDAYVLSGDACALADVAGGVDGVEGHEVAGAFADALGCGSGSLGGVLADIAGSAAYVAAGATGLGLCLSGRGLRVLGRDALGACGEGYGEQRDR
jgi:hypothetical protein